MGSRWPGSKRGFAACQALLSPVPQGGHLKSSPRLLPALVVPSRKVFQGYPMQGSRKVWNGTRDSAFGGQYVMVPYLDGTRMAHETAGLTSKDSAWRPSMNPGSASS